MKNAGKWMLGAAVAVGALGMAATPAKAAEIGIYVGGPAAYVPRCPGPGYAWVAGYYANGYWVPGRWNFVGVRGWDRDDFWRYHRDWDRDGWRDRDRFRGRGWDRDRR
jgi:hypothetical protein